MSDRFADIDLAITEDGDLAIDALGDLLIVEDIAYVIQTVKDRLKSVAKDWFYDNIGADLEAVIGKPNTTDTAKELSDLVTQSLITDNFCSVDDIVIMANPIADTQILLGVFVATQFSPEPLGFVIELNFLTGFKIHTV